MTEPADDLARDAPPPPAPSPPPPLGRPTGRLVPIIAVLVYGIDQLTKYLAVTRLERGERIDLLGDALGLRLVRNPGAAFSMATGATWIFTVIAIVVVIVIIRLARRLHSLGWAVALGLLLGGAVGNLNDRLFREPAFARGHVVDFLQFPHWPIFNVADSCVVVAAVLIAWFSIRGLGIDGRTIS